MSRHPSRVFLRAPPLLLACLVLLPLGAPSGRPSDLPRGLRAAGSDLFPLPVAPFEEPRQAYANDQRNVLDRWFPGMEQHGDPRFRAIEADDFHLWEGSRACGAGVPPADLAADLEGTPRPQGEGYDVGAYEVRVR